MDNVPCEIPGKRIVSSITTVPFVLPSILVVLGFVLCFGNSGILNTALMRVTAPKRRRSGCFILSKPLYSHMLSIIFQSRCVSRLLPGGKSEKTGSKPLKYSGQDASGYFSRSYYGSNPCSYCLGITCVHFLFHEFRRHPRFRAAGRRTQPLKSKYTGLRALASTLMPRHHLL